MADQTQYVRHGEGFSLEITGADTNATTATLKVGTIGSAPSLTSEAATLADGKGTITVAAADNTLATGTYKYQVDIAYSSGSPDIFPDPTKSNQDLPDFIVAESFD